MERSRLIEFVFTYVEHKRFTPKGESVPEARAQDLANLTSMAEAMRPNVLPSVDESVAETICAAYYLGKYDLSF